MEKIQKLNKRRAFNEAGGHRKNTKLLKLGPTFIPDYRILNSFQNMGYSIHDQKIKERKFQSM